MKAFTSTTVAFFAFTNPEKVHEKIPVRVNQMNKIILTYIFELFKEEDIIEIKIIVKGNVLFTKNIIVENVKNLFVNIDVYFNEYNDINKFIDIYYSIILTFKQNALLNYVYYNFLIYNIHNAHVSLDKLYEIEIINKKLKEIIDKNFNIIKISEFYIINDYVNFIIFDENTKYYRNNIIYTNTQEILTNPSSEIDINNIIINFNEKILKLNINSFNNTELFYKFYDDIFDLFTVFNDFRRDDKIDRKYYLLIQIFFAQIANSVKDKFYFFMKILVYIKKLDQTIEIY